MSKIKGKKVLIIGGSSGIGAETTRMLAEEGAEFIISSNREEADRRMVEEIGKKGNFVTSFSGDFTEKDFAKRLFDFAEKTFGVPDIIISCAGIQEDNLRMGNIPGSIIEKIFKVNVTGPYMILQEGVRRLKEADKYGKIILIGSVCTHYTCTDGIFPIYTASKAALVSLVESTRRQICKEGNKIGFTLVCPGTTNTPLVMRNGGQPSDSFMEPEHVASCILAAAMLPNEVSITDMTMINVQQDIW